MSTLEFYNERAADCRRDADQTQLVNVRDRCLSGDANPSRWSLPKWFRPRAGRTPLSYHGDEARWSLDGDRVTLQVVARGQEFVLDVDQYPEAVDWVSGLLSGQDITG